MAEKYSASLIFQTSTKFIQSQWNAVLVHDSNSSKLEYICCSGLVPESKPIVNDNTHIKTNGHSGKDARKKKKKRKKHIFIHTLVMPRSEKRDGVQQTQHLQPPLPTH